MPFAVGVPEFTLVLILLFVVAVPLAAIGFVRSGKGLNDLGKGTFSIDREEPGRPGAAPPETPPAERDEEVRQMVEASNFRRRERGEAELDVQREIDRLLDVGQNGSGDGAGGGPEDTANRSRDAAGDQAETGHHAPSGDHGVRDEIRQLVVANNERRQRRGEDPLDVESEVDRRLREWT